MKKLILIAALLLLFGAIAGCVVNEPASPLQSNQAQPSSSQTEEAITTPIAEPSRVTFEPWEDHQDNIPYQLEISWPYYETTDVLIQRTDHIAVATVLDIEVFLDNTKVQENAVPCSSGIPCIRLSSCCYNWLRTTFI